MSSSGSAASHEASSPAPEAEPLRLVLLGRTGTGRSSSGNTILGRSAFWANVSPSSVTTQCKKETGTVHGRSVYVIDTPGFLHTRLPPQEVMAEVGRSVLLSSPGPHAFLVTLQPSRFTKEERDTLEWIKAAFGPEVCRFTVVLFTGGDQLQGRHTGDFLKESKELLEFVSSCRGGCHVFDNRDKTTGSPQVEQLLKKVDKMVEDNGGGCYSNGMFREAEKVIKDARERILGRQLLGSPQKFAEVKEEQGLDLERRRRREEEEARKREEEEARKREEEEARKREEEEARKREEGLFWCELVTAVGKGAAEGAGIMGEDEGKGKVVKKVKVMERAAALAASPLSITSAAKVVGGAVREGSKVLYKHRKTFLH